MLLELVLSSFLALEKINERQFILDRMKIEHAKVSNSIVETDANYLSNKFFLSGVSPTIIENKEMLKEKVTGEGLLSLLYTLTYRTTYDISTKEYYENYKNIANIRKYFVDKEVIRDDTKLDEEYNRTRVNYVLSKYILNVYDGSDFELIKYANLTNIPSWSRAEMGYAMEKGVLLEADLTSEDNTYSALLSLIVRIQGKVLEGVINIKE